MKSMSIQRFGRYGRLGKRGLTPA